MKPNPIPIPNRQQELVDQKLELEAWLAINTVDYGQAGEAYLCLWHYMISATAMYGFTFDKSFKEKVIPEDHWRDYIEKFVKLYNESSVLEEVPWDNTPQLLEVQEKMNRIAWRCWQCFESLGNTLLTTSTILFFIDTCLNKQVKIIQDVPPKKKVRKVRRMNKLSEITI